jgi:hypothetical protein
MKKTNDENKNPIQKGIDELNEIKFQSDENTDAFQQLLDDNPEGVYQLAPGLTVEEMKAIFFDYDALVEAPQKVYRLQGSKDRYYYTFNEDGTVSFYTSVTTMIKFTMPTSPNLIKWIADMGYDESKNYAAERADYGTFMHKEFAELAINRRYDTTKLKSKLKAYCEEEKLPIDFINHEDELKKDIMAFAQFMIDYKVKPLAVEIVLTHPKDGYAGAVDMPCKMTIEVDGLDEENPYKSGPRKGEPREVKVEKEISAIVDFKSGRKGFYEENEIQLEAYKQMWDLHFPNKPVERIYNFSPKDWRTKPSYNLKDQTDSRSREKLQYLVELSRIESLRRSNTVTIIDGIIELDKGINENVSEISFDELILKRNAEKEKPNK